MILIIRGKKLDITCADFDGTCFRVTAQDVASFITVSLKAPAAQSLLQNGGKDYLAGVYKEYLVSPVSGFDVTLKVPFNLASSERAAVAQKCATLRSYLFSSVILQRMEAASKGQTLPGLVDIALRSQRERMWVRQDGTDRITVIFSIEFAAHNDAVLGQVFCQVFFPSCSTIIIIFHFLFFSNFYLGIRYCQGWWSTISFLFCKTPF